MQYTFCIRCNASDAVKTPILPCRTVTKSPVVNCIINQYHWHCARKLTCNRCVIASDVLTYLLICRRCGSFSDACRCSATTASVRPVICCLIVLDSFLSVLNSTFLLLDVEIRKSVYNMRHCGRCGVSSNPSYSYLRRVRNFDIVYTVAVWLSPA